MELTEAAIDHILGSHKKMAPHLDAVLHAVERPTVHLRGRAANEDWYFLAAAGPALPGGSTWSYTSSEKRAA
ncbi:MAG: hypothetical protein HW413_2011 [Thermoleophilia bacterium]|nr:hypothetical protein [Thermoleophilia bacterium]